ncbi:TRAP transporter large permease [Aneurinibacillus sp. REN35]|uniref:TRAP transporter large permease n=1 Tax=Aneurinibacillus sp. REN35 TaxID=3237286 RepID=UPI003527ED6D
MSSLAIGAGIGFFALLVMVSGMPIAFALGITAVASMLLFLEMDQVNMLANFLYSSLDDFAVLSIPLFIFMGAVFSGSKASTDLFEAVQRWLGWLPGGMAISSIAASAIFAAISGSSPATAAAIGGAAIPEMKRRGYSNSIAAGAIVAGGTLGILIPPSVTLILYGVAVEQSVGKLFIGGIIPGLLMTLLYCLWVVIAVRMEKKNIQVSSDQYVAAITRYSAKERMASLIQCIPFLILIGGVLGSLYLGIATPSEAAAIGALLALLIVVILYRSMTWKKLMGILLSSTKESTMILLIMAFSALLGTVMGFLSIPQELASLVVGLEWNRWVIFFVINLFLLLLGCFLPPAAIILMTAPILYPIIVGLGFDPIWFGIIMTINMEMGLITPPVGLNLFVVKGIAPDIPLKDIIKGSLPYVGVIAVCIVILAVFPDLVTWLPSQIIGE